MEQAVKDVIEAKAASHGLRILIWQPIVLQLVAQEGNGPTIHVTPEGIDSQIAAGLPRLHQWLLANPRPTEAALQASRAMQAPANAAPAPCSGCQANMFKKAMGVFSMGIGLAQFVGEMAVGIKATEEEHDKRKSACESCQAIDSTGLNMYREHKEGSHSCGEPRIDHILRDDSVDGCGCWLELKWWGKNEKCPLGKWDESK